MKTLLMTFFFCYGILTIDTDISMLGIKINDSEKVLDKIKLQVIASDKMSKTPMIKYRTENGNDFSVTTKKGKIVYLENDWLQETKGTQPLITSFTFGKTSLKDIRKTFGTNGFAYNGHSAFTTETDLIEFNCFELDSPNNEILVTITKVPLNTNVTEENVAENLKLDAVIIAQKEYLDELWGKKKQYDKNYKKIKL